MKVQIDRSGIDSYVMCCTEHVIIEHKSYADINSYVYQLYIL